MGIQTENSRVLEQCRPQRWYGRVVSHTSETWNTIHRGQFWVTDLRVWRLICHQNAQDFTTLESYHSGSNCMFCHDSREVKCRNIAFMLQSTLPGVLIAVFLARAYISCRVSVTNRRLAQVDELTLLLTQVWYKQNSDLLVRALRSGAARGQKLHRVPSSQYKEQRKWSSSALYWWKDVTNVTIWCSFGIWPEKWNKCATL